MVLEGAGKHALASKAVGKGGVSPHRSRLNGSLTVVGLGDTPRVKEVGLVEPCGAVDDGCFHRRLLPLQQQRRQPGHHGPRCHGGRKEVGRQKRLATTCTQKHHARARARPVETHRIPIARTQASAGADGKRVTIVAATKGNKRQ